MSDLILRCCKCLLPKLVHRNIGGRPFCKECCDRFNSTRQSTPPEKKAVMSKTAKELVEEKLNEIEQSGSLPMPSRAAICRSVGAAITTISAYPSLNQRYDQVLDVLTARAEAEDAAPTPEQAVVAIQELEERKTRVAMIAAEEMQESDRLRQLLKQERQKNQELRQQQADISGAIAADIESLKQSLTRIRDEKRQIEADERTVLEKLQNVLAYYELKTGERYPVEFEMISTPAASNGKHLEVA